MGMLDIIMVVFIVIVVIGSLIGVIKALKSDN
jgi:hypothetical protein